MELPLTIMDSALFARGRMRLGLDEAKRLCSQILDNAMRFGGTVVVNWHCRSLAPERLWGGFYEDLLRQIEAAGRVWFATASEAVEWFRWRRAIRFRVLQNGEWIEVVAPETPGPGAILRVRHAGPIDAGFRDLSVDGGRSVSVRLSRSMRQHV
jgi:hypothetical protein